MLLMARRVPLVVLILKDFTLYSVSQEKSYRMIPSKRRLELSLSLQKFSQFGPI